MSNENKRTVVAAQYAVKGSKGPFSIINVQLRTGEDTYVSFALPVLGKAATEMSNEFAATSPSFSGTGAMYTPAILDGGKLIFPAFDAKGDQVKDGDGDVKAALSLDLPPQDMLDEATEKKFGNQCGAGNGEQKTEPPTHGPWKH